MGEMSEKCYNCEQLQAMLDTANHYMMELGKELTDADAKIKHLQAENDELKVQMAGYDDNDCPFCGGEMVGDHSHHFP